MTQSISAQTKSSKRGVCWDEKTQLFSDATIQKLSPGISWIYNWGTAPQNLSTTTVGPGRTIEFVPMCWNGGFNEAALRNYLTTHPGVKYLLGFNEPNIAGSSGGSSMTPEQAAQVWPKLEKIADDFGLKLVAPALNFSGDNVGGRVYNTPFDWLEAFITFYPTARMDYLCLHCYMDYAGAVNWFATEYFYKDLYKPDNQAKYPNLVKYLQSQGEKPLFLTEFCAMGNDFRSNGMTITPELQIDQMTQTLQYLEKSPNVAAYAWFMANGNATQSPYWSLMQSNVSTSDLSEVGKVYVHMSAFDPTKYYRPGESILAKDYIDAGMGEQQIKLRSNTESVTRYGIPLQVEFKPGAWATYLVEVTSSANYLLTLRCKSDANADLSVYVDDVKVTTTTMASTSGAWTDRTISIDIPEGRHQLKITNDLGASFVTNRMNMAVNSGISTTADGGKTAKISYYSLDGIKLASPIRDIVIEKNTDENGRVSMRKISRKN